MSLKNAIALFMAIVMPLIFYFIVSSILNKQSSDFEIRTLPTFYEEPIRDFTLYSHVGDTINRDSLKGKIVISEFFFTTCPGICPVMIGQMLRVQDFLLNHPGLRQQYQILSITVDPTNDSISRLKEYATENKVDGSLWWMLTGDKEEIYDLARNHYYVTAMEDPSGESQDGFFIHSDRFILKDKKGFIRGYYRGTDSLEVTNLMDDILQLEIEYEKEMIRDRKVEVRVTEDN